MRLPFVLLVLCFFINLTDLQAQQNIYVDSSATGLNNGTSWANAFTSLDDALALGPSLGYEDSILIAQGTYRPSMYARNSTGNLTNRDFTFHINIQGFIIGGYNSGGTARDPFRYKTILSGDIGVTGQSNDNSYHVAVVTGGESFIEGISVVDGNANGTGSIVLNGLNFERNSGGGLTVNQPQVFLFDMIFENNSAIKGGALASTLTADFSYRVFYLANSAEEGGAVYHGEFNYSNFYNCVFYKNTATLGGAVSNRYAESYFYHTTFVDNEANLGGAIYNFEVPFSEVKNCVFSLNNQHLPMGSEGPGSDIWLDSSSSGNFVTIARFSALQNFPRGESCVYAGDGQLANLNDVDGPDNIFATSDDGFRITSTSPGVNIGQSGIVDIDITGATRLIHSAFDAGAYEINACTEVSGRVVYVDINRTISGTGNSWNDAVKTIEEGISMSLLGCIDTIKVAQGRYVPNGGYRDYYYLNSAEPGFHKTFHLPGNITLLGGYDAVTGIRNSALYLTELAGEESSGSVVGHVITILNSENVFIDGFMISDGAAKFDSIVVGNETVKMDAGGGMYISNSSVSISNTQFVSNYSYRSGGAIFAKESKIEINYCSVSENWTGRDQSYPGFGGGVAILDPREGSFIKNTNFDNNHSSRNGGALAVNGNVNLINVDSCDFSRNTATPPVDVKRGGGAVYVNNGKLNFSNSRFEGNRACTGGAVYMDLGAIATFNACYFIKDTSNTNGGAIFAEAIFPIKISNCVFTGNYASRGAAMYNSSNFFMQFSTMHKNVSTTSGGAMYIYGIGIPSTIFASIFSENSAPSYADIYDAGTNNLYRSSRFQDYVPALGNNLVGDRVYYIDSVNLKGPDNQWRTEDDGLRLNDYSQLLGFVGSSTIPLFGDMATAGKDILGNNRDLNSDSDMGAYENNFCSNSGLVGGVIYVDSSVQNGNGTGSSWANAFRHLDDALYAAGACKIDTIKVAKGTYSAQRIPGMTQEESDLNPSEKHFLLKNQFTWLVGGYPSGGGETSLLANPTIINGSGHKKAFDLATTNFYARGIILDNARIEGRYSILNMEDCSVRNFNGIIGSSPISLIAGSGIFNRCVFDNNRTKLGLAGAVQFKSAGTSFDNCVFADNVMDSIPYSACISMMGDGHTTINNCTFFRNTSPRGAAISKLSGQGTMLVSNSIFWGNRSASSDDTDNEIYPKGDLETLELDNNLFEFNHQSLLDTFCIYGVYPEFADTTSLKGPDGRWATPDDGLMLTLSSPAWNAGFNDYTVLSGITKDLIGFDRIANDTVDLGAYEYNCLAVNGYIASLVPLGTVDSADVTLADCGSARYFVSENNSTSYIALVVDNGNTLPSTTIHVDATNDVPHFIALNGDTTAVANRMVSIIAPGNYPINGGTRVRVYYDSTEFAGLPSQFRFWFKHPAHDKQGVLNSLTLGGLAGATIIHPSVYGVENGITFVEFDNITSYSTFGLVASNFSISLPVELQSFTARRMGNQQQALLEWTTASEQNNDRFEIERTINGNTWTRIGIVAGAGTTNVIQHYSFIDNAPVAPTSYYRIRQVDIDGGSHYSVTRKVEFGEEKEQFTISPNPASTQVFIRFSSTQKQVNVRIMDETGRVVRNSNNLNQASITINVGDLPNGIYIISVNGKAQRLVVMR